MCCVVSLEDEDAIEAGPSKRVRGSSQRGAAAGRTRRGRGRSSRGIGSRGGRSASAAATRDSDTGDFQCEDEDAATEQNSFAGTYGVKASVKDWSDPYQIFCLFFTSSLLQLIVDETNRYAEQM